MKTYAALKAEITKLEKQAEGVRKKELKSVVAAVQEMIAQYDLSAEDLGLAGKAAKPGRRPKAAARSKPKAAKNVGVPKYRDPKTNKTWTGRGKPPNWIVGVKNRDTLLIVEPAAPKTAKPATKAKPSTKRGRPAKSASAKKKPGPKKKTPVTTPAVKIESGAASV